MIWEQPIGIAAIPNNRYLGVEYFDDGDKVTEEVYTGEFLILAVDANGFLRGKVLLYEELEGQDFRPFVSNRGDVNDPWSDDGGDNDRYEIVNHITKDRIDRWIEHWEYIEEDEPIRRVLDVIYSHVYKNLYIDDEAKAYLEELKKKIDYKNGK